MGAQKRKNGSVTGAGEGRQMIIVSWSCPAWRRVLRMQIVDDLAEIGGGLDGLPVRNSLSD